MSFACRLFNLCSSSFSFIIEITYESRKIKIRGKRRMDKNTKIYIYKLNYTNIKISFYPYMFDILKVFLPKSKAKLLAICF